MATPAYQPRKALAQSIAAAQREFVTGPEDSSVVINGRYGERGVIFFTRDGQPEVGFATLGKDHPLKDQTLLRDQAADLVGFLIGAYGLTVTTSTVTTVDVN